MVESRLGEEGGPMSKQRELRDVIHGAEAPEALPVDELLAEIDAVIEAHDPYRINRVIAAIGDGTAGLDVVRRYAKELSTSASG